MGCLFLCFAAAIALASVCGGAAWITGSANRNRFFWIEYPAKRLSLVDALLYGLAADLAP
jgi:hypothetical protein